MRHTRIVQPHVRIGDPHITSDDPSRLSILACMFEALIRRSPGGHFRPGLAHSWTLADDACRWTFELRADVTFWDGRWLTASDVVRSMQRVRDEVSAGELGTSGVFQQYLAGAEFGTMGDHTFTLWTPTPTADLLDLLVDIPIVSFFFDGPSGTGPYVPESASLECVELRARPEQRADRPEYLPGFLTFQAVPDAVDRLRAVTMSDADIASDVQMFSPGAEGSVVPVTAATTVCTTFMFNMRSGPCTDPVVRRALNWALNVPELIAEEMRGAATRLTGPLTERHLGFDPDCTGYAHDPEQALRLLQSAGADLDITLDVPTILPDEARGLAARMSEMFEAVGVKTRVVEHSDRPAYADRVRLKNIHDAACFDSSPSSTFRVLWEKFHSGHAGPWWLGYDNPKLNALVDRARETPEIGPRSELYREAFRILSADAPWLFLYNPKRCFAVAPGLSSWRPSTDGYTIFH